MNSPQHIGFIMDGNGRWATAQGLPRSFGHRVGLEHIRTVLEICRDLGIPVVSGYLWSTENWRRPFAEVAYVRWLLRTVGRRLTEELHAEQVRIVHSGSLHLLRREERAILQAAVHRTRANRGLTFNAVLNYGGRAEILDAARRLLRQGLRPEEVTEDTLRAALYRPDLPDLDLVIRTGGEQRLSNFLLWQSANAYYYSTQTYWPAMGRAEIEVALARYREFIGSHGPARSSSLWSSLIMPPATPA